MSHLHRIQWLDEQIRAGNYPSSAQLSERFEILTSGSIDIHYGTREEV
ncbi:hypothetical protein [Paenibacillus daejeonensis]|nr:hypothetical protein [Paenibacillus daejeonensis]